MDYYKYIELDENDFKGEIASIFKLDLERDLFDIQEDVFNILQNREILELEENKDITLNKLKIEETTCFYISKKETDEEYSFCIFDNYDDAKNEYDLYVKTKTMTDWHNSKTTYFDDFFKAGDLVSEDIVNDFLNSVPPVTHYETFIQAGEPYGARFDSEDNKWKETYTTFEKEAAHWIYKGNCFKNKNIDQTYINKPSYLCENEDEEVL